MDVKRDYPFFNLFIENKTCEGGLEVRLDLELESFRTALYLEWFIKMYFTQSNIYF